MKTKANHKTWILVLVLTTVLIGYVALFFLPQGHRIAKLRQDLLDKQKYISLSEQTAAQIAAIEEQLNNTAAYNRTWTKHAPHSSEISILLGKIHALARAANVEIESFDPEPAEKFDRLQRLPVNMSYSGQLPSVFKFLSDLEQMPQTIWISKVVLERGHESTNKDKEAASKNRGLAKCELSTAIFMDNLENSN